MGAPRQRPQGLSRGQGGARRPRGPRLGLGGRGTPAQLLDATQDPLHVAHLGHAKVLQREDNTLMPGSAGQGHRPSYWPGAHQRGGHDGMAT